MKTHREIKYVNMQDVLGPLALEYNIPVLPFEDLVTLGERVVRIYNLDYRAKTIKFSVLCEFIQKYVNTPFGRATLKELAL